MNRKLVVALACRNNGSRLYGKPIQNLDEAKGIRIIDNIIDNLKSIKVVDEIVLGISEGVENLIYKQIAEEKKIPYVFGDEKDVLSRLISCGDVVNATDILRVTSESPFMHYQSVEDLWKIYLDENLDAIFLDEIIDGCGYEIISLQALKISHKKGQDRHRSELCSLYLRENYRNFKLKKIKPEDKLIRKDLRLTVDNPEDLVLCRELYMKFQSQAPQFNILDFVEFLDNNPNLKMLVFKYTEGGYKTMYI